MSIRRRSGGRYEPWGRAAGNHRSFLRGTVLFMGELPDTAIDKVGTMIDELSSLGVLHTDLHELLEGGVITVIPVFELVEVGFDGARDSFYGHSMLYWYFIIRLNFKSHQSFLPIVDAIIKNITSNDFFGIFDWKLGLLSHNILLFIWERWILYSKKLELKIKTNRHILNWANERSPFLLALLSSKF